jgi:hypothetical protein
LTHLKNNVAIGFTGFFHFGPGFSSEYVNRFGAAADSGVCGGYSFWCDVLLQGAFSLKFANNVIVYVVSGKQDFHFSTPEKKFW